MRLDKDYLFDVEGAEVMLVDLFRGRSQLLVYYFMYSPDWDEGCPSCSAVADGFDEMQSGPDGMELPVGVFGTE